jgi:hypothetical protein
MKNHSERPIIVNGQQFQEGAEIRRYINEKIRNKYPLQSLLNHEDVLFIKALLRFSEPKEFIDSIQSIMIDYNNTKHSHKSQKIFWKVKEGKKDIKLNLSRAIDRAVSTDALIFTSKKSKKTLRIYPVYGKKHYSKQEGRWQIIIEEITGNSQSKKAFIRDIKTKEVIGYLNKPSLHKIAKVSNKTVTGKIDIVPSLLLTSDCGNTVRIIQTEKHQEKKNCLTSNGEWIINTNGSVLDAETEDEIGTLDLDSFDKVAERFCDQSTLKANGKLEKWENYIKQRTKVLRYVIYPQIEEHIIKEKQRNPHRDFSNYQVDHRDPLFTEIVENWMIELGLTWENLDLYWKDGSPKLKSKKLAVDFYNYHKEVAKLDYIPGEDNRKKSQTILG